ncbi:MAG TPA: rod shape-determining protein MreC [Terriglobales bacterium]|nr:rod shape-determining protein MreC [Terriglobales bacterium]
MDYATQRKRPQIILGILLLAQLFLLSYQVRRPDAGGVSLVRFWSAQAIVPLERATGHAVSSTSGFFGDYVFLRNAKRDNQALRDQVAHLTLENAQLRENARELPQLEALLGFQHAYGIQTMAATVIGGGTSPDAQALYVDRGSNSGLHRDEAVVVPQGLVGKLSQVLGSSAQVLLISDPESGVGALIGASGVHGILRGLGAGRVEVRSVLKDEAVKVGDEIITSGEDQVYPKGIPIGTVTGQQANSDGVFRTVQLKLAADLGRIEQVLIITGATPPPAAADAASDQALTAAEVRQAKLPSLPKPAAGIAPDWPKDAPSAVALPPGTPPVEGDALGVPKAKPAPPGSGRGGVGRGG